MQFPRCTVYLITNHSIQAMPAGFTVLLQMNPLFKSVFLILNALSLLTEGLLNTFQATKHLKSTQAAKVA